ncbi:MAG: hypothetical protein HF973_13670 [Chloroflexi bacterium]|nr:hypothetical protein [Chloroflexota bacterium]
MFADLSPYLLTFSRLAIIFLFALSGVNKLREFPAFAQAVARFQILPDRWARLAAVSFAAGELAIVIMMLLGGPFLLPGFWLAIILLLAFSIALMSVLMRKLSTSCHYFGAAAKPVTVYSVWRNAGFIACAFVGWFSLLVRPAAATNPNMIEQGFLGIMAVTFVIVLSYVDEVVALIRTT